MNILIVIPYNLFVAKNGNAIRVQYMMDSLVRYGHNIFSLMYDIPLQNRMKIPAVKGVESYLYPAKIELLMAARFLRILLKTSVYDPLCSWMKPFYKFKNRVAQIIKKNAIDIIQCENVETYWPIKKIVSDNIPIVLTAHDVVTDRYVLSFSDRNLSRHLGRFFISRIKGLEISAMRSSSLNICMSESDANRFVKMGINSDALHIIPNGVDTEAIRPLFKDQRLMKSLGIKKDEPVLFFGGSDMLQNTKAVDDLITIILPRVLTSFPNVKLMFTGTVSGHVKKRGFERLYPANILNVGYVENLANYYSVVDVVVLPITLGGGTKLKAAEAFAAGKPVISTPMGVVGYDVTDGEDLIIEDKIEKFPRHIRTLLNNKSLMYKFSKNVRRKSLQYDWRILMQKYDEIYKRLKPSKKNDARTELVNCNFCGSDESKLIFSNSKIVKCKNCGWVYTKYRTSLLSRGEEYNGYAKNWYLREEIQRSYYDSEFEEVCLDRIKFIEKFRRKGKLLDIGCGNGLFLKIAQKQGWVAEGIELSPLLVEYLQKKKGLLVRCGDFEQMIFTNDKFDVITMWEVLDHMLNPKQTLNKIFQLLKDDGIIAVSVNNINSLERMILGGRWRIINPDYHLTYFTQETVKKLFRHSHFAIKKLFTKGLSLYEIISTRFYREIPGENISYCDYRQKEKRILSHLKSRTRLFRCMKKIVNFILNIVGFGATIIIIGQKEQTL